MGCIGQDLCTGLSVGSQPICDHLSWCLACATQHLFEEPLSSSFVPFGLNQNVQYLALLIHCTPQVLAFIVDLQIDLIQMPDALADDCRWVTVAFVGDGRELLTMTT